MKKILAVSGGVDSVVLLHMLKNDSDVVVAHFDHGIRPNSHEDYDFVEKLAKQYGLPFFGRHASLGKDCSEEAARKARYLFLQELADSQGGRIYLAHHADDLVESAIINLLRGTGWRGLAPLMNQNIERPLLNMTKAQIYRYAAENNLHFRLDQSNTEEKYFRNRIRRWLFEENLGDFSQKMRQIAEKQREIASEVAQIESEILPPAAQYSRQIFCNDDLIDMEIMRQILANAKISLTRPALKRALNATKSLAPGKKHSLDKDHFLSVKRYYFSVQNA